MMLPYTEKARVELLLDLFELVEYVEVVEKRLTVQDFFHVYNAHYSRMLDRVLVWLDTLAQALRDDGFLRYVNQIHCIRCADIGPAGKPEYSGGLKKFERLEIEDASIMDLRLDGKCLTLSLNHVGVDIFRQLGGATRLNWFFTILGCLTPREFHRCFSANTVSDVFGPISWR